MPSHGSVAKSVRQRKEAHPERFCRSPRCLWWVAGGKTCPKHPVTNAPAVGQRRRDGSLEYDIIETGNPGWFRVRYTDNGELGIASADEIRDTSVLIGPTPTDGGSR